MSFRRKTVIRPTEQAVDVRFAKPIGVTIPFNNPHGLFTQSYTNRVQVFSNLKNLLLTVKGERVMQPSFGTNLQRLIFEQSVDDLANEIETELQESINYWLPYIIIQNIDITAVPDTYTIRISLTISVTETGSNLVINILAAENSFIVEIPNTPTYRLTAVT